MRLEKNRVRPKRLKKERKVPSIAYFLPRLSPKCLRENNKNLRLGWDIDSFNGKEGIYL